MAAVSEIYPTLARIIGQDWIDAGFEEFVQKRGPCYGQLEADLLYLTRTISKECLVRSFWAMLRDTTQWLQAVYEIYTAAVFASISDGPIELHVPKTDDPNSKNFDFRVRIKGCVINGDVKTRKDESLWRNGRKATTPSGIAIYQLIQNTTDPVFLDEHGRQPVDKETPASKELRQRIEDALTQLPENGPNIVVIGDIEGDLRDDLENALYGDEGIGVKRGNKPKAFRYPNGLFSGLPGFEDYNKVNAVIWLRLEIGYHSTIKRRSQIFFNRHAIAPFPPDVEDALIRAFDREKYLCKELQEITQKIIDAYQPEKIVLFGSLASGDVHELSDIDLLVIKQTSKPYFQRLKELALLVMPKVEVNFFVYTPEEFEQAQKEGNFFIKEEIQEKGRIIYERASPLA